MSHLSIDELSDAFDVEQIGFIHPTYEDPITGETVTYYGNSCLGDTSVPHTPAERNDVSMHGFISLIHEAGSTAAELAASISSHIAGDIAVYVAIRDDRADFRTELAACTLGWDCPDGEMTIKDPRDPEIVSTKVEYNGLGVTVRDYRLKGVEKGSTVAELAAALREYVGDPHTDPQNPVAPDSTTFDVIMSAS